MRTIGLIGGMSWESTAVYYRRINEAVRQRLGGLHSADILLHSLDFDSVVRLQKAEAWDQAGALLGDVAARLETAGAGCILICTNTMHLVADAVQRETRVPVLNIIDETARRLTQAGCRRPLLLATRYTMEHGFYAERMARSGIEVRVPDEPGRALVHRVIFEELCRGIVSETSRGNLVDLVAQGLAEGADGVILGCTEICMILDPAALPCPGFDSTAIHAGAAVDFALSSSSLRDAA